jgi:GDP-D-mannose 3',5'-epimerase
MKTAIVLGGNGLIGHHIARRLKSDGYWVRVVDIERYAYGEPDYADEIIHGDLRDINVVRRVLVDKYQEPFYKQQNFDVVFQMAADMGGAEHVFSGNFDADIMHNSALINLNVCKTLAENKFQGKIFFASSACIYPQQIQEHPDNHGLKESDAYPVNCDSDYGFEKIYSERVYQAFHRNYGLDIRIGRFHNVMGIEGTWNGVRTKAPAAICRKVAEAMDEIIVFGDGAQTRSFIDVEEAITGVLRLMNSDYREPINIGSDEMISINDLAYMVMEIAGKKLEIKHIDGPTGVRGRNSDNTLIREKLNWSPSQPLRVGMTKLYSWISKQVENGISK